VHDAPISPSTASTIAHRLTLWLRIIPLETLTKIWEFPESTGPLRSKRDFHMATSAYVLQVLPLLRYCPGFAPAGSRHTSCDAQYHILTTNRTEKEFQKKAIFEPFSSVCSAIRPSWHVVMLSY
jgi:hypothetical protein